VDVMEGENMDYSVVLSDSPVLYEGKDLLLDGFVGGDNTLRLECI